MQPEDVQDVAIVDRAAGIGHRLGDPLRLALALVLHDVGLAPARIGQDEPDEARSDDQPDDEQPPVELGVHLARVQGSGARGPGEAEPPVLPAIVHGVSRSAHTLRR